jgi:ribosomal protein L11 methyltransferase
MDYIQLKCKIESDNISLAQEILIQELATMGFDSFEEIPSGIMAYIPVHSFDETILSQHRFLNNYNLGKVEISFQTIKEQNWNEEWENNFQPVLIDDVCYIRAPFHQSKNDIPYEIIIEPKMAFGTGHHETTSLMIGQMLLLNFTGKYVLDMGCGTGVLAMMASKLKAEQILAIDIDEWAYKNTMENCAANKITNVIAEQGNIDKIYNKKFDIILANINRNILLEHIPFYSESLSANGFILMSGIYEQDITMIKEKAEAHSLTFLKKNNKNNWITVLFVKGDYS